jgi:Protein of unknown function (DUF3301)
MGIPEFLGLLLVAAGGWFFWDSLKAREAANAAIRAACQAEGLLLLDDTVGLASVWPARNDEGRVVLRRVYGFEYSDTGNNRRKATVELVADRVSVSALYVGPRAAPEEQTWH